MRINAERATLTGDLGFIDSDGFLFVTGREKDLIIRGGVNISPLEIDNVVLRMPGVADVATVGVPDSVYGQQVVVYVAPHGDVRIDADSVRAYCARHLAEFKMPGSIVLRDNLPKTARGKMDRNALAREWTTTGAAN